MVGGASEKVASRVPAVGLECEIPAARCIGMRARAHVSITLGIGWQLGPGGEEGLAGYG